MARVNMNGDSLMDEALSRLGINLVDLIAEVSVWASPQDVKLEPIYPDKRRGPAKKKGKQIDGIYIDDNTYANVAIKKAIGREIHFENFHACHIWPGTVYDERYYSLIPNLVLIPKIIAGLSDHYKEVIDVLKYRSYELYGWYPSEEQVPQKPAYYPSNWTSICTEKTDAPDEDEKEYVEDEKYFEDRDSIEVEKVKRRVPGWLRKNQINSKILYAFMELLGNGVSVSKKDLEEACANVENFTSNFNQMRHFGRNNHGKVFDGFKDDIMLWQPVSTFVRSAYANAKR